MKQCTGCGRYVAWCICPYVLGFRVRTDERMGSDQVAIVNDDGCGMSLQDGEITPFIMPPEAEDKP